MGPSTAPPLSPARLPAGLPLSPLRPQLRPTRNRFPRNSRSMIDGGCARPGASSMRSSGVPRDSDSLVAGGTERQRSPKLPARDTNAWKGALGRKRMFPPSRDPGPPECLRPSINGCRNHGLSQAGGTVELEDRKVWIRLTVRPLQAGGSDGRTWTTSILVRDAMLCGASVEEHSKLLACNSSFEQQMQVRRAQELLHQAQLDVLPCGPVLRLPSVVAAGESEGMASHDNRFRRIPRIQDLGQGAARSRTRTAGGKITCLAWDG
ncbi:hypothetical protein OH77DRAFT_762791 [Trametes cingulata]|nr:hypothetical protein OH77DRAFT_762791 [Trametes cingulata]